MIRTHMIGGKESGGGGGSHGKYKTLKKIIQTWNVLRPKSTNRNTNNKKKTNYKQILLCNIRYIVYRSIKQFLDRFFIFKTQIQIKALTKKSSLYQLSWSPFKLCRVRIGSKLLYESTSPAVFPLTASGTFDKRIQIQLSCTVHWIINACADWIASIGL